MAIDLFANNASATVSSGGTTAPAAGTSEAWTLASIVRLAASTGVTQMRLIDPAASSEIMLLTNLSGTAATVTRGAEGTTPVAHTAGFTVQAVVTGGGLAPLRDSRSRALIQLCNDANGTGYNPALVGPGGYTTLGTRGGDWTTAILTSGATVGSSAGEDSAAAPLAANRPLDAYFSVALGSTTNVRWFCGIGNANGYDADNPINNGYGTHLYAGVQFSTPRADANFMLTINNDAIQQLKDTGIPVDTAFHNVTVSLDGANATVTFDGVSLTSAFNNTKRLDWASVAYAETTTAVSVQRKLIKIVTDVK